MAPSLSSCVKSPAPVANRATTDPGFAGFDEEFNVPSALRAAANAFCAISGNGGVGAIVKISGLLDTTLDQPKATH